MCSSFSPPNLVFSLFKLILKITVFVALFDLTSFVNAAVVTGLYQSQVEVASQQAQDRQNAFNEALVKTLIKLSGQKQAVNNPSIYKTFFPAERFVQSFSYTENPRYKRYLETQQVTSGNGGLDAKSKSDTLSLSFNGSKNSGTSPLPFLLSVEFSAKSLENKMKIMKLPIWGNVRPDMMLWVLVESEGSRRLLGESETSSDIDSLKRAAAEFVLPMSLPKADQIDLQSLNMSGLWGLFPEAIDTAKTRYSANGHLMVRIYQSASDLWSANWLLNVGGYRQTGSLSQASFDTISRELISFTAEILSNRYAASTEGSESHSLKMNVTNINSFNAYVSVQRFLEQSNLVKSLNLESMQGDVMSFKLELKSSIEQFNEYITLSGKMQPTSSENVSLDFDTETQDQPESAELSSVPVSTTTSTTNSTIRKETYKWLLSTPDTKN